MILAALINNAPEVSGPLVSAVIVAVVLGSWARFGIRGAWYGLIGSLIACVVIFGPPKQRTDASLPDNPDDLNSVAWLWKEFREDLSGEGDR